MGSLVKGRWVHRDDWIQNGHFIRPLSWYREQPDLSTVEPGRYHLVASLSCPWSHRALLLRVAKDLQNLVPLHVIGGARIEGYAMADGAPYRLPGLDRRVRHLHEVYSASDPCYSGRATVPLLWDAKAGRIVCNESERIVRAFNGVTGNRGARRFDFYPESLRGRIDTLNRQIHEGINDGVYRAGYAQSQTAYDRAVEAVFAGLDSLENTLAHQRFLCGSVVTEADWRLFPTLVRFDAVYHQHFKCSRRRLRDYPNLWAYTRDLIRWPGVAATIDLAVIRKAYYGYDREINPYGVVPQVEEADFWAPHDRHRFGPAKVHLAAGAALCRAPALDAAQSRLPERRAWALSGRVRAFIARHSALCDYTNLLEQPDYLLRDVGLTREDLKRAMRREA